MKPYMVKFTYTESGKTEECGFLCRAADPQHAAEKFWNMHPGQEFKLVSITTQDGIELFRSEKFGRWITIPRD